MDRRTSPQERMSAAEKIDTDLEAFRAEARDWLEKNFPPSLKGKSGMMMGEDGPADGNDYGKWKKAMGDKGWGTPTYPKQYGGGGLRRAGACAAAGNEPHRRVESDRRHGRDDVRSHPARIRQRGAEEEIRPRHRAGHDLVVPGL